MKKVNQTVAVLSDQVEAFLLVAQRLPANVLQAINALF
jgi:hypothetical protein